MKNEKYKEDEALKARLAHKYGRVVESSEGFFLEVKRPSTMACHAAGLRLYS